MDDFSSVRPAWRRSSLSLARSRSMPLRWVSTAVNRVVCSCSRASSAALTSKRSPAARCASSICAR
ncbi:hypothetical protein ACFQZ4_18425 [Catellatospora coxensis]